MTDLVVQYNTCVRKRRYRFKFQAEEKIRELWLRSEARWGLTAYKCKVIYGDVEHWHIGHKRGIYERQD